MLRRLWALLFGSDSPSVRRLMACEDAVNALEARVEARYNELKALRGEVHRMKRAQVDPQETNEHAPDDVLQPQLGPRPVASTAHLAARFRSG